MRILCRSLIAALAFTVAAVPLAQAQSRHDGPVRNTQQYQSQQRQGVQNRNVRPQQPNVRQQQQRPAAQRQTTTRQQAPQRARWNRGSRVPDWQRRPVVNDWQRHGLRRPGAGQRWVKVDNDYLLIGIASGIIAGIIAGR